MLRNARKKAGLDGVRARTEQLPFTDGAFERIIVIDALHHFARREEALAELVRVLKPTGRMLIEEPDLNLPIVKLVAVAEKLLLMESHFATPGAIGAAVQRHGLSPPSGKVGVSAPGSSPRSPERKRTRRPYGPGNRLPWAKSLFVVLSGSEGLLAVQEILVISRQESPSGSTPPQAQAH